MITLGITGNIGSGKSTLLTYLARKGIPVISTDALAHQLLKNNTKIRAQIKKEFGTLVRAELAALVFTAPRRLKRLEAILHPAIAREVGRKLLQFKTAPLVAIEVPLLFEAGWRKKVDHTLLVTCARSLRKKRYSAAPHADPQEFERRELRQKPEAQKRRLADFIVNNSGSRTATYRQLDKIIRTLPPFVEAVAELECHPPA